MGIHQEPVFGTFRPAARGGSGFLSPVMEGGTIVREALTVRVVTKPESRRMRFYNFRCTDVLTSDACFYYTNSPRTTGPGTHLHPSPEAG